MPAPALSEVVIGLTVTSDSGFVVWAAPAPGLLTEVPPVLLVNGIMASVSRFVPRMLRAAIWGSKVSAMDWQTDAEEHSPVVQHLSFHPTC
jgi:hypothetical protein